MGSDPGDGHHTHLCVWLVCVLLVLCCFCRSALVAVIMTDHMTPAPGQATPPPLNTFTPTAADDVSADHETFVALIGGIVGTVLLLLIGLVAVLLCCMSRQKGSYLTNETDDGDDDESVQSREPLKAKEAQ